MTACHFECDQTLKRGEFMCATVNTAARKNDRFGIRIHFASAAYMCGNSDLVAMLVAYYEISITSAKRSWPYVTSARGALLQTLFVNRSYPDSQRQMACLLRPLTANVMG